MITRVKTLYFENNSVRVLYEDNGDIWLLGADILRCLDYAPSTIKHGVSSIFCDVKGLRYEHFWFEGSRRRNLCINLDSVALFFSAKPRPNTHKFAEWIVNNVDKNFGNKFHYKSEQLNLPLPNNDNFNSPDTHDTQNLGGLAQQLNVLNSLLAEAIRVALEYRYPPDVASKEFRKVINNVYGKH